MISFEEAENIALNRIGIDCALLREYITERPYGWHFCFQSKSYIETGNIGEMIIGSGGFLVEKEGGKVIEFGSAFTSDENFKIYEKGLFGRNDLIILKVREVNEAVRLLNRLQMKYVKPEFEHGISWKIPKIYNQKQIKEAISKLPCVFKNQNFYFRYDEFQKIEKSKCFEYELRKPEK